MCTSSARLVVPHAWSTDASKPFKCPFRFDVKTGDVKYSIDPVTNLWRPYTPQVRHAPLAQRSTERSAGERVALVDAAQHVDSRHNHCCRLALDSPRLPTPPGPLHPCAANGAVCQLGHQLRDALVEGRQVLREYNRWDAGLTGGRFVWRQWRALCSGTPASALPLRREKERRLSVLGRHQPSYLRSSSTLPRPERKR